MHVRTASRIALLIGSLLGLFTLLAIPAAADPGGPSAGHDPAGNNGTIKIDGQPFDDAADNEPHPGCTFQVDFYGFDAGSLMADVTFEAWAPTAGGVLLQDQVPIGEDSHAGGGSERGLDASRTYDLSSALAGIAPHPKQGWHVRLTVHADGSQGADVKHKMFWVQDCAGLAPTQDTEGANTEVEAGSVTASTPPPAAPTPATQEAPAPATATTNGTVSGTSAAAAEEAAAATATPLPGTELPTQVEGLTVTRAQPADLTAPQPSAGHSALARTGMTLGLLAVGAALIAGGIFLARGVAPLLARTRS
jgi:hypothetical protein